jgi:hypothetical protein
MVFNFVKSTSQDTRVFFGLEIVGLFEATPANQNQVLLDLS